MSNDTDKLSIVSLHFSGNDMMASTISIATIEERNATTTTTTIINAYANSTLTNNNNNHNNNPLFNQRCSKKTTFLHFNHYPTSTTRIKEFLAHYNNNLHGRIHCSREVITRKLKSLKLDKYKKRKIKSFFMCGGTLGKVTSNSTTISSTGDDMLPKQHTVNPMNSINSMNSMEFGVNTNSQNDPQQQQQLQSNETICKRYYTCDVCITNKLNTDFIQWNKCGHSICVLCAISYIYQQIMVNFNHQIVCHQCTSALEANEVQQVLYSKKLYNLELSSTGKIVGLTSKQLYDKYEKMCLDRALCLIPDLIFCPGKNCTNAVIAENREDCPKIKCENKNCGIYFCYYCKSKWHPDKNCTEAMMHHLVNSMKFWSTKQLSKLYQLHLKAMANFSGAAVAANVDRFANDNNNNKYSEEIRMCPKCKCVVVKENDGKCNLVDCNICQTQFCWLCMQPNTDTHYVLPTGCTYFGKKKWTHTQTLCWRLALMSTSPIWLPCACGLLVPFCVLILPIYGATVCHYRLKNKIPRNVYFSTMLSTCSFFVITLMSPVIYAVLMAIGIPITLYYTFIQTSKSMWNDRRRFKSVNNYNTVRHKLSLSYVQEQLFLIHMQWALSQLAQTHTQMDKLSAGEIQKLLSDIFNENIKSMTTTTTAAAQLPQPSLSALVNSAESCAGGRLLYHRKNKQWKTTPAPIRHNSREFSTTNLISRSTSAFSLNRVYLSWDKFLPHSHSSGL